MRTKSSPSLLILFLLLFFSCSDNRKDRINSLIYKIDSLNQITTCVEPDCKKADSLRKILIDSLYQLDSTNYVAITEKAIWLYNEGFKEESLSFFRKILSHDSVNYTHRTTSLNVIGMHWELKGEIDSAHLYYRRMIPMFDLCMYAPWMRPQLITVLDGTKAGFTELEQHFYDTTSLNYHYLRNDISNYNDDGLQAFFPYFDQITDTYMFSIVIPEDLYKAGLNSIDKVALFYARKGVNIDVTRHYSTERRFVIRTNQKYIQRLIDLNVFALQKM